MSNPASGVVPAATILVVDDTEASRYLAGSWLRRNGYRVLEAATGESALATVASDRPDLVLLDVNLPDISGMEVCERIKADPLTAVVPVIHMSATAVEPDDRTHGLNRGADGYLVEPVDQDELVAVVESALRYSRARAVAELLARRLTKLTEATLTVNSATTLHGFVAAVATGAAAIFDAPATAVVTTPQGRIQIAGSETDADRTAGHEPAAAFDELAASVLPPGHRTAVIRGRDLSWRPGRSSTVVLARAGSGAVVVGIAVDDAVAATEHDHGVLIQLGQVSALAADALRNLTREHELAVSLQRSFLPRRLPVNRQLPMAARYLPASRHAEIGGDFYEVTELDGRLLIAVGDVSGHSLEAALVMGEVRHALRAYAVEGHGLVAILDRLDVVVSRFHPQGLTTACLMLVDPAAGTAEVACAGHLPPLLADASGARYLDVHGPLLGVGLRRPEATKIDLPAGTLVLLITDGLIERSGTDIDAAMAALAGSVSHDAELEALCDDLLDRFGRDASDDIALLTFRREA
ncbi:Serine phosphatase RsbU, regulator of sigma subunit [Amycolatopsis pretoriensis]|uniref:Serine phosphatase RsbU, regulator of sigma subunit n=1 Tax=Amycolatopsis pretoriensis TaxID=218821 RepID=A0A1H5QFT6_9PSEU|nr:fused response regulator/phosphatase [Amycolatopsis pretoriensis]SEF24241.1 Serine phosphatase RsbU, regulator of sigma subunit [Amycolatopsis pretoriensis]